MAKRVKLTKEEKDRRKNERKAQAMNAAALRDVGGAGSLFATEAETYTPADAFWHRRHTVSRMVSHLHEGPASPLGKAMQLFRTIAMERDLAPMFGDDFGRLRDKCRDKFRCSSYWYTFWKAAACGEAVTMGLERYHDPEAVNARNPEGVRCREITYTCPTPMSAAEFYSRFPYTEPTYFSEPEHDDAGLFDRVMSSILEGCKR